VYGASKTEAERAIWRITKESGAQFQVSTILPNAMFGPLLKPGGADSSSTATWLLNLFNGDADAFESFPPQYYVDVRDTARLQSIALRDPSCHGERLFSFAAPFNRSDVLALFRELRPGKTFPADDRETGRDLSVIPNEDANELLKKHYGKGFASLKECVQATIDSV
jgi:nucleoside-diphosphate-sugar epimerase